MPNTLGDSIIISADARSQIKKALESANFRTTIRNLGYQLEAKGIIENSVTLYSHIEDYLIDGIASYAMKTGKLK